MQSRAGVVSLFSRPIKRPSINYIESCHRRLLGDTSLLRSLALSPDLLRSFRIGLMLKDGKRFLVVPYRDGSGNYESIRHIPLDSNMEAFWDGFPEIPYWVNRNLVNISNAFITNNELDAIKLASWGLNNVIAIPFPYIPLSNVEEVLSKAKAVYLLVKDREEVLKRYDLALRIGLEKTFSLVVPELHGRDVLERLLSRAMRYNLQNVLTFDEALSLVSRKQCYREGFLTPWKSLNEKVRSIYPGQLVVVSADPKIGKTTLCLNIAHFMAKKGFPVLFYCLEMSPEELAEMVVRMEYGISEDISAEVIKRAREELSKLPFLFAREHRGFEDIVITVRESVKLYGIKFFVFDNLQFLLSDIDNWYNEASMISKRFKTLASELNIVVFMIVQARKRDETKPMTKYDIRDSSTIAADADQIWRLFRKPLMIDSENLSGTAYSEKLMISVEGRFIGGGQCALHMDGATKRIRDLREDEKL